MLNCFSVDGLTQRQGAVIRYFVVLNMVLLSAKYKDMEIESGVRSVTESDEIAYKV